jgi:beta-lactamase class D
MFHVEQFKAKDMASRFNSLPEVQLIRCIITQAFYDCYSEDKRTSEEARRWFESPQSSFPIFCSWLGWDDKVARNDAMAFLKKHKTRRWSAEEIKSK